MNQYIYWQKPFKAQISKSIRSLSKPSDGTDFQSFISFSREYLSTYIGTETIGVVVIGLDFVR